MVNGTDASIRPECRALREHARDVVLRPEFKASDRLKALLVYLCDRAGGGLEKPITQREIALDVLGLNKDFDPVADAHVRIEVGRLRVALALFYANCPDMGATRLEIPKGAYEPVLRQDSVPMVGQPSQNRDASIQILTTFDKGFGDCSDLIDLVATGLRFHCHSSPLVSTGMMRFEIETAVGRQRAIDLAKTRGAQVQAHIAIVQTEFDCRIFIDVRETASTETKWCQRYEFLNGPSLTEMSRRIARTIATALSDPILGVVPRIALTTTKNPALQTVLQAYNFMASQKLGMVGQTIDGLEHLAKSGQTAPAVLGLLAELKRVSGRLTQKENDRSSERYLELAEEALSLDVDDITCRMALGFAKLNVGQTKAAYEIGKGILALSPPVSLIHKAKMLMALADSDEQPTTVMPFSDLSGQTSFYMQEFAEIIPKLRNNDIEAADRILSNSLYGNIFWLHVFQAAVCAETGETRRARYSADRIRKLIPGMEHMLAPLIGGFFPKENESQYIINGLRRSGLETR
ncbi:MAG: hypothetical protein K8F59_13815 [Rhodobacteraceae bacterium]|nr:hypothetical protein [Paracoccaceae bacterium]